MPCRFAVGGEERESPDPLFCRCCFRLFSGQSGCSRAGVPRRELPVPEPRQPEQLLLVAGIRPFREGPIMGG